MFDAIAHRYDRLNRILSMGIDKRWRRKTVAALRLPDGPSRVLDVATGTGDLALDIARRHPAAHVVGVDPSVKMLARGVAKVAARGLDDRITLDEGDAQALTYPDASFDGATIAFGIRNVPDRARGLAEMARVVRPGGRVCVLELSEPRRGIMAPLARFHVHVVVPRIGALLSGAREYRYLQKSIAAFPPPDEFAAMMAAAGLEIEAVRALTFGVCHLYVGRVPGGDEVAS
ncbi:MAG: bifunctional demethylmenaquinone methyltransferase/2-methoxy-6-polyprenyl-1,4-benzoquinol methylase UbiE [Kofleriaceae bacterium]|nr:bifunctional demethylmenaquinone methyltransferase/2-methoxy-6-polyprenyl-1,4-benzoquinol methylase UbiE [Kofleriaceae bacterium]MCB9573666.1 bifunctional demethylmenaquinone methyltransferase/2-methoxy-6-polyprenyl-1,4-benzoquinol methylase UbiE [Kofleriaceae bacterium]